MAFSQIFSLCAGSRKFLRFSLLLSTFLLTALRLATH